MSQNIPFSLPLELLLQSWEREVRPVDPATRILIQELLQEKGSHWFAAQDLEGIRQSLGPILAQNEEEQAQFTRLFQDEFVPMLQAYEEVEVQETNPEDMLAEQEEELDQQIKKIRPLVYLALAAVLLVIFFRFMSSQMPDAQALNDGVEVADETIQEQMGEMKDIGAQFESDIVPPSNPKIDRPKITRERVEKALSMSIKPSYGRVDSRAMLSFTLDPAIADRAENITWRWRRIDYPNRYNFNARTGETGVHSLVLHLRFPQGAAEETEYTIFKTFFVPKFNPNTQEHHAFFTHIQSHQQNWMKVKILGLFILLLLFTEGGLNLWKNRRRTLAYKMEFDSEEDAPYELPFEQQKAHFQADENIEALATQLKLRRKGHLNRLDIQETVRQTIQTAGMPQLVFAPQFKAAVYLALIDRKLPNLGLYHEFIDVLAREDLPIQSYEIDWKEGKCYDTQHPEGIEISKLFHQHPHSQLMLFSKGEAFIDDATGEFKEGWKETLDLWEERMLLTPIVRTEWGLNEFELTQSFQLLPIFSVADKGKVELVSEFKEAKQGDTGTPQVEYDFSNPADVKSYLGDELYDWVRASMLYPKPSWEIFLAVGQAIQEEKDFAESGDILLDVPTQDFVSLTNLLKIHSLPWLQEEEIPADIRKTFLTDLDPELEIKAREAILDVLEREQPVPGSQAYAFQQAQIATQQAALHPQDKLLQKKLRYLWSQDKLDVDLSEKLSKRYVLADRLGKIQEVVPLRQSLVVALIVGVFSLLGYRYTQHQPLKLANKYIAPEILTLPLQNVSWTLQSDLPLAMEDARPQFLTHNQTFAYLTKQLSYGEFSSIENTIETYRVSEHLPLLNHTFPNNPEFAEYLKWHEIVATLGQGRESEAIQGLNKLIESGTPFFKERAYLLKWELQRPWFRAPLDPAFYLNER